MAMEVLGCNRVDPVITATAGRSEYQVHPTNNLAVIRDLLPLCLRCYSYQETSESWPSNVRIDTDVGRKDEAGNAVVPSCAVKTCYWHK